MKEYYKYDENMSEDDVEDDDTSSLMSYDSLSTTNDEPTPWDSNIIEIDATSNTKKYNVHVPKPVRIITPYAKTYLTVLTKNKSPTLVKQKRHEPFHSWKEVVSSI